MNFDDPHFIETLGLVITIVWACFMISLERLFPYTKGLPIFREGFWLDFFWYTIFQSYFLGILIFKMIIAPLKMHFGLSEFGYISHWPKWVIVLLFLFTHDFYIYWFHRLQHNVKLFWRTHEAHHSVKVVDWLAGSRSHFLEIIINQTIEFAPIIFLLDSHTAAIIVPIKALIDAMWGMWIHANVDVRSGKLQYVINGPEMHQWHHSNHQEVFYCNYSTKFAFWDWIFGTGFLPGLKPLKFQFLKPQIYGLPYDFPKEYFEQNVFAFFRFDHQRLEKHKIFNFYIYAWKIIINLSKNFFGLSKAK